MITCCLPKIRRPTTFLFQSSPPSRPSCHRLRLLNHWLYSINVWLCAIGLQLAIITLISLRSSISRCNLQYYSMPPNFFWFPAKLLIIALIQSTLRLIRISIKFQCHFKRIPIIVLTYRVSRANVCPPLNSFVYHIQFKLHFEYSGLLWIVYDTPWDYLS